MKLPVAHILRFLCWQLSVTLYYVNFTMFCYFGHSFDVIGEKSALLTGIHMILYLENAKCTNL